MLRTNLSTKPFYNERLVHLSLGVLALLVAAVTVVNLWQVFVLSGRNANLGARIADADAKSAAARAEASRIRARIDPHELDTTAAAAREANTIIERRAFSWTELFNRFEETLPDNVRITSVRPKIDDHGAMTVTVVVVARNVEGIDTFIENMERGGTFSGFLATDEFVNEDGHLQTTLVGQYAPPSRVPAKGGQP
jgi:Tfp pilus assembly protein PilN